MVLDEFAKSFLLWRTEVVTWVSRKPDNDGHALLLRPLRMVSIHEDHANFGRQLPIPSLLLYTLIDILLSYQARSTTRFTHRAPNIRTRLSPPSAI